jgi:hypothetical protein
MRYFIRVFILVSSLCLSAGCTLAQQPDADGIAASFVVFGDNQLNAQNAAPGEVSHANVAQLQQTLKDIAALKPRPSHLFFNGDLVDHGDEVAGQRIADRLAAWTKLYRQSCQEVGLEISLVPVPGNKDMLKVGTVNGAPAEVINPESYPAWREWLKQSGFNTFSGNGPTAAPPNRDWLAEDNSPFTYSFNDTNGNHFIVINTFTVNNQPQPPRGWIPYHWIAEDARKAEADPRVRRIFAFGHLPIRINGLPFDTNGDNSILSTPTAPLAEELLATFGKLAKFRGYFCGHLHLWDASLVDGGQEVWQVIAGNSGSKPIQRPAGEWQPPFYFGFSVVRLHQDGRVGVVSYRRPVPDPYYAPAPQPPAQPQPEVFLPRNRGKSPGQAQK